MDERLRVLASTDDLTGVPNRRHFLELGNHELQRTRRYERHLGIMMIDFDRFKSINDSHGHAAGDDAIRAFTRVAEDLLRGSDILGRLGGEEFGVIMPETGREEAIAAAERLRRAIAQTDVYTDNGAVSFTVSIGVSMGEDADKSIETALNRADKALYAAKASGRNRVIAS